MSELQAAEQDAAVTWPDGTVVDFETIDHWTSEASGVAHPLDNNQIRTPDWVIDNLAEVSRWAERMVTVIATAEEFKRKASADLADARAQAVLDMAEHPTREQASRVRLATVEQRKTYDRAVVAFEKARRVGNLLSDYTSRLQSIGKQVEITYRHGGGQ